jgi:hypothetical protein
LAGPVSGRLQGSAKLSLSDATRVVRPEDNAGLWTGPQGKTHSSVCYFFRCFCCRYCFSWNDSNILSQNTNFYCWILGSSDREAYPWSWSSRLVSSAPCQRIWPGRKITIEKFTPKVSRIVSAIFIIDKSGRDFYVQKIQNYPTYIWRKGWWQNTTPFIPTSIASEQLSYSGKLVETFYLQNGVDKKSSWRQHKCFF